MPSVWDSVRSVVSAPSVGDDDNKSKEDHSTTHKSYFDDDADENNDERSDFDAVSTTNDGSTGHEMVDRTLSMVDGGFSVRYKDASFICAPYKCEVFQQQLDAHCPGSARRSAVISSLQDLGVKVFIIDSISTPTTSDLLHHVRRVVSFIARENRVRAKTGPLGYQRCLLYQDHQGRLFNLVLSKHAIGPAGLWHDYLDSFSGLEAIAALTILCRSLPCAADLQSMDTFQPAYLSLILGLVLTEEISLSWLNASMMVRAAPSVGAHTLISPIASDLLRKAVVLTLALAGVARDLPQQILTLVGVALSMIVLCANLGARAWLFMRWQPQRYDGCGASLVAYIGAVITGLVFPFMGHRSIEVGGKAGVEYVIRTAIIVAIIFVASDIDQVQKFLVVGSETCNQDSVNFAVGLWWFGTFVCSLLLARKIPYHDQKPIDAERLLIEDHASPAGYRVPLLPDYEIDPSLARTGYKCFSVQFEVVVGLLLAFVVGAAISLLAFTGLDEFVNDQVQNVIPSD